MHTTPLITLHSWLLHSLDLSVPFEVCGITASSDSSEDGDIYYLKPGQVATSAAEINSTETAKLNLGGGEREGDDGDNDPFASDVEADLEEDEAVTQDESAISTLASHLVYS